MIGTALNLKERIRDLGIEQLLDAKKAAADLRARVVRLGELIAQQEEADQEIAKNSASVLPETLGEKPEAGWGPDVLALVEQEKARIRRVIDAHGRAMDVSRALSTEFGCYGLDAARQALEKATVELPAAEEREREETAAFFERARNAGAEAAGKALEDVLLRSEIHQTGGGGC